MPVVVVVAMPVVVVVAMPALVVAMPVVARMRQVVLYLQMLYEHPRNYLAFRPDPSALVSMYLHPILRISLLLFLLEVANLLGPTEFCSLIL